MAQGDPHGNDHDGIIQEKRHCGAGPINPKRDDYLRLCVEVADDQGRTPAQAWDDAVSFVLDLYGAYPTEDGTIGQHAQLIGADGSKRDLPTKGRWFSFGVNLYGRKVRALHAHLAAMHAKYGA